MFTHYISLGLTPKILKSLNEPDHAKLSASKVWFKPFSCAPTTMRKSGPVTGCWSYIFLAVVGTSSIDKCAQQMEVKSALQHPVRQQLLSLEIAKLVLESKRLLRCNLLSTSCRRLRRLSYFEVNIPRSLSNDFLSTRIAKFNVKFCYSADSHFCCIIFFLPETDLRAPYIWSWLTIWLSLPPIIVRLPLMSTLLAYCNSTNNHIEN